MSTADQQAKPAVASVNWIAFKTLVVKEIRRFMRIWVQTIVPPAVSAVLYMMIFGKLIGSRIGVMDGHSYIDFVVPGIIMMAVCLLYTSPSPRDATLSRMPSSA